MPDLPRQLTLATHIGTLGCDIAVTVFLHETTVAPIFHIGTLKTQTFLILFDGRSVTLAILEMATEFRTIGIACNTLAMNSAIA
ncbi:MAG: hypothetical protein IIT83_04535, partial [Bacteroidales bacterium]|nr:hypothetical protein [Bacteroidales bacterium]